MNQNDNLPLLATDCTASGSYRFGANPSAKLSKFAILAVVQPSLWTNSASRTKFHANRTSHCGVIAKKYIYSNMAAVRHIGF